MTFIIARFTSLQPLSPCEAGRRKGTLMIDEFTALTIKLNEALAAPLITREALNDFRDRAGDFEVVGSVSGVQPDADLFDRGTLRWVDGAVAAVLIRSYEEACGFEAVHLLHASDGHVILSSRPS